MSLSLKTRVACYASLLAICLFVSMLALGRELGPTHFVITIVTLTFGIGGSICVDAVICLPFSFLLGLFNLLRLNI